MNAAELLSAWATPATVPLVPEIRLHTASAITPVWRDVDAVPYWCVPWAGGQALARYVLDHPGLVRGARVVDFGSGSALVAIAAKLAGAVHVVAVDIDPFAAVAAAANASLNGVSIEIATADLVGASFDDASVLLAGDVWYDRDDAPRFAAWFRGLRARGATRIVTGDPGRHYVPGDLVELARYEVPTTLDLEGVLSKTTRIVEVPPA